MSTELLIASHLRLANKSLKAAQSLLRDGNRNAVYNAEQAVEMIVLALAQSEAVHYPRQQQHQLDTMVRGLPANNAFIPDLSELTWLEAYATAFRYPRTRGGINDAPRAEQLEEVLDEDGEPVKESRPSLRRRRTGYVSENTGATRPGLLERIDAPSPSLRRAQSSSTMTSMTSQDPNVFCSTPRKSRPRLMLSTSMNMERLPSRAARSLNKALRLTGSGVPAIADEDRTHVLLPEHCGGRNGGGAEGTQ